LPHPSLISNWTSTVNAEPVFFKEVFEALQSFPTEDKDCNLVLDEMSIRKQILWDSKNEKFIGYCDFGNDLQLQDVDTPKKTFIIGLTIAILSVFSVAKELLPNNTFLKYILTYRFLQDHIELLFSRIRKGMA